VDDQQVVLASELHRALEDAIRDDRSGRIVRVVQEHQPRPLPVLGVHRREIGSEPFVGS